MSILTEQKKPSDWLKGEAEDPTSYSRDVVTVKHGQVLGSGTVVAALTSGGKIVALDPGASAGAGSDTAVGIILVDTDATDGDLEATIISRDATVISEGLTWPGGVEDAGGKADLIALGILFRTGA